MCEKISHILLVEQVNLVPLLLHVNELVHECPFRAAGPAGESLPHFTACLGTS